jgi:hypothetical protein
MEITTSVTNYKVVFSHGRTAAMYLMEKGVLPIEEVGVGPPDLGEELPVHRQLLQACPVKPQPGTQK